MPDDCIYKILCKYYNDKCIDEDYRLKCWAHTSLNGIIDLQVFKSRIQKRKYRSEHGHSGHELPKEGWADSGYVDND